jgi:hypothetical protein
MEEKYLTDDELLELPPFKHLKRATLARWRCAGKGPNFIKIGRKPFYRLNAVIDWLRRQEENSRPSIPIIAQPPKDPRTVDSERQSPDGAPHYQGRTARALWLKTPSKIELREGLWSCSTSATPGE